LDYVGPDVQHQLIQLYDLERKIELNQGVISEELSVAHKRQTRLVVDLMKSAGFAVDKYQPYTGKEDSVERFCDVLRILRELLHDKFNTTVEEDLLKFEILRDTVSREQTASADVKALNREFQSERNLRRVEVQRRDAAIAKLSEELQVIQESAQEDSKEFERLTKSKEEAMLQTYQKEEEELLNQVKSLETTLQKTQELNKQAELSLRQERRKRELGLDGLLTQYDKEMTEKTKQLENLTKEYGKDNKKLGDLDKDIKVFDEDHVKRDEEEKIENERKLHLRKIADQLEKSSKLIQAFWRGYAIRLMIKKKAGKKKKGGGKGKKK